MNTIYFGDKALQFTDKTPAEGWYIISPREKEELSRAKIEKILESHNNAAVVAPDYKRFFDDFISEFTWVEAAGGVVINNKREWLMIHRNGRWDFPKGHIEQGEMPEVAAVREIFEETGVRACVIRPLCRTLHAYYFAKTARWELKQTRWYELRVAYEGEIKPQTEEGIACAAWCAPEEVETNLCGAFPTIRRVAEAVTID